MNANLSLDSDISLYAQLVGIIKRNISTGVLAVGDLLPSEAELCRALNISRNTVRQAIGELEDEGLVVRKRGRGTFVADPSTNRRGVRYSFTTEVSSMGKEPSSTLVDFEITTPPAIVCSLMLYREALGNGLSEPKQQELREIGSIMNDSVTGWEKGAQHRFEIYGQQRSWRRVKAEAFPLIEEQLALPDGWA